MTFLPKFAAAREALALIIALPVSLFGAGVMFYMLDAGARFVA